MEGFPMQSDLTYIAYILDRSGSMQPLAGDAIGGFNAFLSSQQAQPGRAHFTLVLFDHEYLVPVTHMDIAQVSPLDSQSYVPRGQTALLDAIGRTIDEVGQQLAATPEEQRPSKVIVAIFTDGLENASRRYTHAQISAMIRRQQEVYSWEFLFLAANQDAVASAAKLSIPAANAMNFAATPTGVRESQKMLDREMSARRKR
jgi:uncharacterized protein YegL